MSDSSTVAPVERLIERLTEQAECLDSAADNIDFPAAYLSDARDYAELAAEVATALRAQQAEIERLREAIKPFARHDLSDPPGTIVHDDVGIWQTPNLIRSLDVTYGDFRRARAALQEQPK
jgi:hypothetical protein